MKGRWQAVTGTWPRARGDEQLVWKQAVLGNKQY
ncbi:Hypothetical protein PFCIRM138_00245 [Propionibacterium freudenreichii subsp. freudenreichii]|uniref:Uncharacterized protein n=2 Tax=Propionibacterium freudenreichii TaxID=1744 RepID=D7GFE1_PROFC|nr:Hypothetical protein PFREUD_17420 [Propionibacterium freudenreichii subsp. shermanii CIRM-BIA1]CEG92847.1 Hypothetical protein PFCIRM122_04320 [Propionibacterium freudenreichii]CEP27215.1 Hypothetical protein PFCIRM138_00245 [Propionibacterium freudenreichii subsp. freudenreichii]CEG98097.1 Hypothetical protein PFCIRM127_01075 [Propionibacterium freudenreichii]CEH04755.1 Hypothetical protein PFCIRM134_07820 [Propionibacterium freudenreichii]